MSKFNEHGNVLQKGFFQLKKGNSIKNKEFRKRVCKILGIRDSEEKTTIFIANYHWKLNLLEYLTLNKKYRTSLLPKAIAKQFGINDKLDSFNKKGLQYYSIPNHTKNEIKIEIESLNSNRSRRSKRRKMEVSIQPSKKKQKKEKSSDILQVNSDTELELDTNEIQVLPQQHNYENNNPMEEPNTPTIMEEEIEYISNSFEVDSKIIFQQINEK